MSEAEIQREEEALNTLEEFIQHQALVDWPVMYEEHLKTPPDCMLYTASQQICEYLRAKVPVPSNTTSTIMKDVENLWRKVNAWTAIMHLNQTEFITDMEQEVTVEEVTVEEVTVEKVTATPQS